MIWLREDWDTPVGFFNNVYTERRSSKVAGHTIDWVLVKIPEFRLGHRAALLLLQGVSFTKLLIPGHRVEHTTTGSSWQLAHLILRVDRWEYWRPAPALTGLVLAKLGDVPAGVSPSEVLGALAFDSVDA